MHRRAYSSIRVATVKPHVIRSRVTSVLFFNENMEHHRVRIGDIRYVRLTPEHVIIEDDQTSKSVPLTLQMFSKIVFNVNDIDEAIAKLKLNNELVNFRLRIGGPWCVSISSGYHCVHVRKYFMVDGDWKPTRVGITLRLPEWEKFKEAIDEIHRCRPDIAAVLPCYLQEDHIAQTCELFLRRHFLDLVRLFVTR